ncbi:MAG: glycosyltransferase family 4 protein [Elusimicrobiota bacterium]
MKRIKVCHIITKLELGGAQQNTLYTVGRLDRERFEPVLISGKGGILDEEALKLPGARTFFTSKLARRVCPATDSMGLIMLFFILRREKPEVVHTHSSKAGILGRIAAWLARVPVVIHTFHGFGFHELQIWPVRKLFILLERMCAGMSDKLIVVSNKNTEKALANGIGDPGKFTVIRSGIEISKYRNLNVDKADIRKKLGIKSEETVITTIGPFKPQKNLDDFIKTADMVLKKKPDTVFLMIGDGELRPHIELLIHSYNLSAKIILLGWRRDIPELLAVSDIFAMTSLWEGLPRSVLEAMCAGLPVVANAVDGVKEIVAEGKSGFLVKPHDNDAMSGFLLKLANDANLRKQMGKFGRNLINREYDIDFMVEQQEELYMSLLKQKGIISS